MRLTPEDHQRIACAIARAEATTSGEIFCVLSQRVSTYRDVALAWAAGLALLVPLLAVPMIDDLLLGAGAGGWQAAHLTAGLRPVGVLLMLHALVQVVVFLAALAVASLPQVRWRLAPAALRRARVRRAAVQQFLAHGLEDTEDRTGVLIFAAMGDHQVEVVADRGIHARVPPEVWANAVDDLVGALRERRPVDGFEAAVARVGAVLAAEFPPRPRNPDELPNRLIEI